MKPLSKRLLIFAGRENPAMLVVCGEPPPLRGRMRVVRARVEVSRS